ncbi:MAG: M24 family metallopeptidase [Desulfonatronovibrionaceae bacterium]
MNVYQQRTLSLQDMMVREKVDHFLVQSPANRFYLSGFELFDPQCNESAGSLLVCRDKTFLLTDPRYAEAGREFFSEEDIFVYTNSKFEQIRDFFKKTKVRSLGFEPQWMNYELYTELKKDFELFPVRNFVEELRMIKDQDEIDCLQKSCQLNHKVFKWLEELVVPGMTEAEIAWEAEKMFRENKASGLSFSTIVASGQRAALPHANPRHQPISAQAPLLVDMGCRFRDYCSDQTRTFWIGEKTDQNFVQTKELVLQAQELAISRIEPEMPIREAYDLVVGFFEKHGVHKHFTHALGHGIGLETHEMPSLGPRTKGNFKPGMVVTVEPGLYYPEWGGVRWEFMILITEKGNTIL